MRFSKKTMLLLLLSCSLCAGIGGFWSPTLAGGDDSNNNGEVSADINAMLDAVPVEKTPLSRKEIVDRVNKFAPGAFEAAAQSPISCAILDPDWNPTTTVVAAWTGSQNYWFNYKSGGVAAQKVTFIAIPLFAGSNVSALLHGVAPMGSATGIVEPFGIAHWGGGSTEGYWLLIVTNDLGHSAYCWFQVVP